MWGPAMRYRIRAALLVLSLVPPARAIEPIERGPAVDASGSATLAAQRNSEQGCRGDHPGELVPGTDQTVQPVVQTGHSAPVTAMTYSPHSTLLATASEDGTVKLWDASTGQLLRTISVSSYWVHSVAFSPDGCMLAASSGDHKISLWNLESTLPLKTLGPLASKVGGLAFSPDGRSLASVTTAPGSLAQKVTVWDLQTGEQVNPQDPGAWIPHPSAFPKNPGPPAHMFAMSPDGKSQAQAQGSEVEFALTGAAGPVRLATSPASGVSAVYLSGDVLAVGLRNGQISIWDKGLRDPLGTVRQPLQDTARGLQAFATDPGAGALFSAAADGGVMRWSLSDPRQAQTIRPSVGEARGDSTLAGREDMDLKRPEPPRALTGVVDGAPPVITETYEPLVSTMGPNGMSANGGLYFTSPDRVVLGYARVVSPNGTPILQRITDPQRGDDDVTGLAFSCDGKTLAIGFSGGGVDLWTIPEGTLVRSFDGRPARVTSLALSCDGRWLASGSIDKTIRLWDLKSPAEQVRVLSGHAAQVLSLAFSSGAGEQTLASGSADNRILLWNVATGASLHTLEGHTASVNALTFDSNRPILVSGGEDGSVRFWDTSTYQPLATLLSVGNGEWLATTPGGFFDGRENTWSQVLWQFNGSLFDVSPVEIGFRDYFFPQLLAKALSGEVPATSRSLASLNRAQPAIRIVSVQPDSQNTVRVAVNVQDGTSPAQKDQAGHPLQSGAYDVRLFRNGKLVAVRPQVVDPASEAGAGQDLEMWRRSHQISLAAGGTAIVSFPGIRLAHYTPSEKNEFSAYAFNVDRVKSSISTAFPYPAQGQPPRRAYLITMGVNANESGWDLDAAVPSAESVRSLLHQKLVQTYSGVIDIPLYSDRNDQDEVSVNHARKASLQAVFDLLAGRSVDPSLRNEVDAKHQIQPAAPDDIVVLYVASHGFADPGGNLYLIPSDTGQSPLTEAVLTNCRRTHTPSAGCHDADAFLRHSISSADLFAWWQGVDAGESILILDSCHSGAAPGRAFRPAPLGDPGFGQLSYDKRMLLLAASQPDQTERAAGRFTLLVEALDTVARGNPAAGLTDWLRGVDRQLPITMETRFPDIRKNDVQSSLLLDFTER